LYGVDHVGLESTPPGATPQTANMSLTSGSTYSVVIGSFEQAGTLSYRVRAYDRANNASLSVQHSKVILPCDSTAPDIKNIRHLLHPSQGTLTVLADVTDASALEWLRLYYQPPSALAASTAYTFVTMTLQSGITYAATVGPFSNPGTLSYYVQARDVRGNQGQSSTTPLTVITDYEQVWLPIIMR
jgi:hypothetical protein